MSSRTQNQERWTQRIEDWKQSNQSQAVFCKERGLNYSTFGYWCAKLNKDRPSVETGFIELKTSSVTKVHHAIELKLAGGMSVCWQVNDFKELAYQLHTLRLL
jgi:hypothetical protein